MQMRKVSWKWCRNHSKLCRDRPQFVKRVSFTQHCKAEVTRRSIISQPGNSVSFTMPALCALACSFSRDVSHTHPCGSVAAVLSTHTGFDKRQAPRPVTGNSRFVCSRKRTGGRERLLPLAPKLSAFVQKRKINLGKQWNDTNIILIEMRGGGGARKGPKSLL